MSYEPIGLRLTQPLPAVEGGPVSEGAGSGRFNSGLFSAGLPYCFKESRVSGVLQDWHVLPGETAQLRVGTGLCFGLISRDPNLMVRNLF